MLDGRIVLEGSRFYLASPQGNLEAHLLAEGMRKIGALLHLIVNGSLMKNGFLFWDEPEANLNPNLITKVVETLRQLAKFGVQVFLASHDYLLTQRLSLLAEQDVGTRTQFFCLTRPLPDAPVIVSHGLSLADLPENPILTEFARYYDDQRESFERKE
ncbi:MAG: AAA family ATPase [Acidobacteriota bacterium]